MNIKEILFKIPVKKIIDIILFSLYKLLERKYREKTPTEAK